MRLTSRSAKINPLFPSILELPFWLSLLLWAILPSTKTPWFEIESIPVNSKDLLLIAVACFYLLLAAIKNSAITACRQPWHYHLPILTIGLLLYAALSVTWSGMDERNSVAMLYTLILTISAFLLAYTRIRKMSPEFIRSFLWKVTVFLAAVGLLYSAESFFSLGLGTDNPYESDTFGIQRVRGPLFVSTTGFFILIPALAFSIEELVQSPTQRILKVTVVFSLILTILGLGSRAGLLIIATFFMLMILLNKNKKQAAISLILVIVVTTTAALLFFSKAKTDRLQSLEDSSRSETYLTSFKILEHRDDNVNIFGSGYGSYWPWYIPDIEGARQTNQYFDLVWNPYGPLLYHPHSTFLLLIVELGIPGLLYFLALWSVLVLLLLRHLQSAAFPILNCGVLASAFSMFFDFFLFRSAQVNTLWWLFLFAALALNFGLNSPSPNMNHPKKVESSK